MKNQPIVIKIITADKKWTDKKCKCGNDLDKWITMCNDCRSQLVHKLEYE